MAAAAGSAGVPGAPCAAPCTTAFRAAVLVGVGHALGAYLTMVALTVGPISLVQMSKSCEMVTTVVLCGVLAGAVTPVRVKRALGVAVLGVVVFSSQSSRQGDGGEEANSTPRGILLGLLFAWASNWAFSVRNVVPKLPTPPPPELLASPVVGDVT